MIYNDRPPKIQNMLIKLNNQLDNDVYMVSQLTRKEKFERT
jgi:hypothetical protein